MGVASLLYRIARAAAWGRAIGKLASGNPSPIAKRVRNKYVYYKLLSRLLR
jgi:hypothetical protein